MDDTDAFRLQHDKKVYFFDCHQRFLPSNHSFRNDTWSFLKGQIVRKGPPKRKFGAYIIKTLDVLMESENGVFKCYSKNHNCTHKNCLWELPYANALILPHNIDMMHQEQNVVESIMSMCLDVTGFTKDNVEDLVTLRRPKAPFCLKLTERKEVLRWLKTLKFPNRYIANIK
jgi:hypothetical protein